MSGGAMVWLTDHELALLLDWYWHAREFDSAVLTEHDAVLRDKLDAKREEVACKVPGPGRGLARDA